MNQLNLLTQELPEQANTTSSTTAVVEPVESTAEFSSIEGQNLAVSLLLGAIAKQRIAPAYLFAGPKGVGKSLATKCFLSQAFDIHNIINHPDVLWIEPTYLHQGQLLKESEAVADGVHWKSPSLIRIEQVREITQFLSTSALLTPKKAVVIESAEKIQLGSANALLKTLEETNTGTIILLSDHPQRLLATITSRCQPIPFQRLSSAEITIVMKRLGQEHILSNPIVRMMAAGSPGQAISHYNYLKSIPQSLLEQLATPFTSLLDALKIAKEIEAMLEFDQQLWLLSYLQHSWKHQHGDNWLSKLEEAKVALLNASPRLVWEVLLLQNS
ncbi:DNA polymerase III subunit delta' [Aetokthonos hydrillicola Thurmond2011]|jgi:DNA polymerase-3 subunit delta'|uniref:DNA polymerase III subunit delta n=1 Tax=Aetokthonos hydrillicola Thurmond2011 TaxID=2712845 RepID=A0AAP5MCA4_9CYAN|nr:DNA polymerase III subunit delta' [Aetokthonos hydrillicola]MBO3458467.1 DNA polymerase III subunit delta' [Aetokthonos hydrillicola CCALA 1050]MBW4586206.1 DNA polymerase III subunit delta' [Aetokthonos hydrillicola CCALA 1050]MDR9897814.1 DNA polymerase III subunit delta' [Aetokthonos hydrillicola Thurmond2011]